MQNQLEIFTENGNCAKPMLVAVIWQLSSRGFSSKNRDKINDDRLGIKISLTDIDGRYVEIFNEKTYWHILHYGFERQYLPVGFDILFNKDIQDYSMFLDKYC